MGRLGSTDYDALADDCDLDALKPPTVPTEDGVNKKLEVERAAVLRFFARGWPSEVWRASIRPYPESEWDDWPNAPSMFRAHYTICTAFRATERR